VSGTNQAARIFAPLHGLGPRLECSAFPRTQDAHVFGGATDSIASLSCSQIAFAQPLSCPDEGRHAHRTQEFSP
jgi:hypothetical protein